MQKFLAHSFVLTVLFAVRALTAHAMYENPTAGPGGINVASIPCFLVALVNLTVLVGTPIIVVFIIYSGFLFVSAGDNESAVGKAKTTFMWTVIGALVLLGAKAIALAIQGTVLSLGATGAATAVCT